MIKKLKRIVLALLTVASLGYLFFLYLCSLFKVYKPAPEEKIELEVTSEKVLEDNEISLLSWNLGYAGLGVDSDFSLHGGQYLLPQSKVRVLKNLSNITDFLTHNPVDYFLLQEVAGQIKITHYVDLLNRIRETLADYNSIFSKSLFIKKFPLFGDLIFGNAIFSRYLSKDLQVERIALPLETKGYTGIFNQKFHFLKYKTPVQGSDKLMVVFNLHLAAFDEGGLVRKQQLELLKKHLLAEYETGNYVVAGGDWNHVLTDTEFPYIDSYPQWTKKKDYMDWLVEMPTNFAPAGWKWGVDNDVPSVRSLEKPYVKGENYTSIIDGYLVSPNIEIIKVKGFEQNFSFSDHQPVMINLKLKDI